MQAVWGEIAFSHIRRYRLMQICTASAFGLLASLVIAESTTFIILIIGLGSLLIALGFAFKYKLLASAYILLGSMTTMLFALAVTGAGLFDLAIIGYPELLIFAAILGGVGLFLSVILIVLAQCFFIAWLTLQGFITVPILTFS